MLDSDDVLPDSATPSETSLQPAELRGVWTHGVAAALLCVAVGEPVGAVIAAAGTPLAVGLTRLVQGEWRAKKERRAAVWCTAGGNSADGVGRLIDAASISPARLRFASDVGEVAERSLYPERLWALAECLRNGLLAERETKLDVEQEVVNALAHIERPHLAVLNFLAAPRGDDDIQTVGAVVERPELFLEFKDYGPALTRIVGLLVAESLVQAVTANPSGPPTYGDLANPPPLLSGWRITALPNRGCRT